MRRVMGWTLAAGTVAALGGLWLFARNLDLEPEPSCTVAQPIDEFAGLFEAAIDAEANLPAADMIVQGPARRTRSESREACVVLWTHDDGAQAMIGTTVVEVYLDAADAADGFRYSEYSEEREANAKADRFIDNFAKYGVSLPSDRTGSWETRHLMGCVVARVMWRADRLPPWLWSPEERDELVRSALADFAPVCAASGN